jgi:hypothetical protein
MEPNAAELIMAAHHHIRDLFSQFDRADEAERRRLLQGVIGDIGNHTRLMDEVFLPKVADQIKRPDLVEEARKDNKAMSALLEKISSLPDDSEHLEPTFKLIEETMHAHIEVEESLILPLAKQLGVDLQQLGQELKDKGSAVDEGDQRLAGFGS